MAPTFLTSILSWLRAGYPEGVPEQDYVPLLALLSRRLSPDEVRAVAQAMMRAPGRAVDDVAIGVQITRITDELPREQDVNRVRARLAAAGWPLADPHLD